ncbi:ExeM/NucH family extracellular endonuclease [Haliea sp. E17]|uniref:ExeM/NucH family extracellular endonuclease n=1 Tax=Haliea sp. E17 TaxID=3401576 RepID=UPI003AACD048
MPYSPRYLSAALAAILFPVLPAAAQETALAWDMVDSTSGRLNDHTNTFAGAFSNAGDGAEKYRRGVSGSIPFSVLDDTVSFSADALGIIDESNLDEFFGITDTVNGDNASGDVLASWEFDISGASDLGVSIGMGAMGDFEAVDVFVWRASIDGGAEQVLFTGSADEAASLTYVLASGKSVTIDDPMTVSGVTLSNQLLALRAPVAGTGNTLKLTLAANTDGGSEAFAFQDLVVLSGFEDELVPPPPEPEPELTLIHAVQGAGEASPLQGIELVLEAVVVGDFQNNGMADDGELNGFFLQEEDTDADGDSATSEGIFVYYPGGAVDVSVGDRVRVTGVVSEFNGLTEVTASAVEVLASGVALPAATELLLPVADIADFEAVEGMRVVLPQSLVISEYYNFDRFGEIVLAQPLAGEARAMTPTAVEQPNSAGYFERADLNARSRITLDDGRTASNPDPARHPNGGEFTLDNRFRGGDLLTGTSGVMHYAFDLYRVQPTQGASYTAANPRPASAPAVGGEFRVAAFNVLNYFTTLDNLGPICGPSGDMDCRGADNADEFERQRSKIIAALAKLDAAVIGLVELENSGAAIDDLVAGLNAVAGAGTWAAIESDVIGSDAIRVGFIYQPALATPQGDPAILDSNFDGSYIDTKNRPALAQTFAAASGGVVTAVVNHFKSKGSDCNDLGDPDIGDGQGNCNITRSNAAQVLAQWLATDPTASGDPDFLILGDLNSYDKEDPITALAEAGYSDLLAAFEGELAYSYVFDGQVGYLDHALASAPLALQVAGAATWHINADEPDLIDYDTSFKKPAQAALFAPDEFRSSDHDPVVVGLSLFLYPESPADCARFNWRTLRRADGSVFEHQRECVLYTAGQR